MPGEILPIVNAKNIEPKRVRELGRECVKIIQGALRIFISLSSFVQAVAVASTTGTTVDALLAFEVGTVGALATPAALDGGMVGALRGYWTFDATHTRISDQNFVRRTPLLCNGVLYDGTGSQGLLIDHQAAIDNGYPWDRLEWRPPSQVTGNLSVTALMKFKALPNPNDTGGDMAIDYFVIAGYNYSVMQCWRFDGGKSGMYLNAHGQVPGTSTRGAFIPIETGHLYSVTLRFNVSKKRSELLVLDGTSGAFVGASECESDLAGAPAYLIIQDYLKHFGGTCEIDLLALDWTNAAFPLEPFTVPAVTNVTLFQSEHSVATVEWNGDHPRYRIERKMEGQAWQILVEDYPGAGRLYFEDVTVMNGQRYEYRITGKIGEHESAAVAASSSVQIDDALFTTTEHNLVRQVLSLGHVFSPLEPVGFQFTTGNRAIRVTKLGAYRSPLSLGYTTVISLRDHANTILGAVQVSLAEPTEGFRYVSLPQPIVLQPNSTHYLYITGQYDKFSMDARVVSSRAATVNDAAWDRGAWAYLVGFGENVMSGPLDFKYDFQIPPSITTGPTSRTVLAGASTTFSVVAAGTAPLTYEWRFNNATITGATGASYTIDNVQSGDGGTYTVRVQNAAGWADSAPAVLTVVTAPNIITGPTSINVNRNSPATFSVVATGTAPLAYAWRFGNTAIPGATNSSFTLSKAQAGNAGTYTVTITNAVGTVTSQPAMLTVAGPNDAPSIVTAPADRSVAPGGTSTFSVFASGTNPMSYQWRVNNIAIVGATNTTLVLSNVQPSNAGSYTVNVANAKGSATSVPAVLTVVASGVAPTINTAPASRTVTAGASTTFNVVAAGTAPLSYQWRFNDVAITGATNASFTLNTVAATDAGNYTVFVSNSFGSIISTAAVLTVAAAPQMPPNITTGPTSRTVTVGASTTFNVVATGTAPLAYQWHFNNVAINGASNASLTLNNVGPAAAGNYSVSVSNAVGTITSAPAVLSIAPAAPTNLVVESTGKVKGTANLSWSYVSGLATDFYIERASSSGGTLVFQRVGQVNGSIRSFTDVVTEGQYTYRVQAFSSTLNNVSPYSNAVNIRVK